MEKDHVCKRDSSEYIFIMHFLSVCIDIERRDNEEIIIEESNQYQTQREAWNGEYLGGVVFEPGFRRGPDGSIPRLNYTVRLGPEFGAFTELFTLLLFPTFQLPGPGFSGTKNILHLYQRMNIHLELL